MAAAHEQDALCRRGRPVRRGLLRRNPDSVIIPFDDQTHDVRSIRETILACPPRLAKYGGGGTNCCAAAGQGQPCTCGTGILRAASGERQGELDRRGPARLHRGHDRMAQFVKNQARLHGKHECEARSWSASTCSRTRRPRPRDRADILNVGGFSDAVFSVVASFLSDHANRFVAEVEAVQS